MRSAKSARVIFSEARKSVSFMTHDLANIAKSCQAYFAKSSMAKPGALCANQPMRQSRRTTRRPMPYLRAWRETLGLSRPAVVNKLLMLAEAVAPIDQATLAKWETGESRVTVEDLELLAKVYGVTADRLFFPPSDTATPALLKEAHSIITGRDPEAVKAWLASGQFLPKSQK